MSCVRKLFKRKFFRTQSSETILVAQQTDNSGPCNPASASTASSSERSDASSAGSDGNVAPAFKPSLDDQPVCSATTVVVAGGSSAQGTSANTSTSSPSAERRQGTADLPASISSPRSSPRLRASRKRPSAGPVISACTQPPETQGTSDSTGSILAARPESSSLPSESSLAQSEGLLLLVKKEECHVTKMERANSSKGRPDGPSSDAGGRLPSSGSTGSHSKGISSSILTPPHKLPPAATEATVLTALMASPSPGRSTGPLDDEAGARRDLGFSTGLQDATARRLWASSQSRETASSTPEPEPADPDETRSELFTPPSYIPFLQDEPNAREPSLLSSVLPNTTPPGAWGEELDVEAPPVSEAVDQQYELPTTEESHQGAGICRSSFLAASPALAGLIQPGCDASISDDTTLPEYLFVDCDDSDDTPETQEFPRPMNPTPDGGLRNFLSSVSPEDTSTPSQCSGEEIKEKLSQSSCGEEETCASREERSKVVKAKEGKRDRKVKVKVQEKSQSHSQARTREKADDDGDDDEMDGEEEEFGQNWEEANLPQHLLDVFELMEEYSSNRPKLNSGFKRLNRRQRKMSLLQQQVMQQARELNELSRLITIAETQTSALRDEKKELDVDLQKTCERMTDVDEANSKKHEPLMYKKFCAVKTSSEAKTLLISIRSRQRALHFIEALTYRKFLSLQTSLKLQLSGSGTAAEKERKLSKRLPTVLPTSPKKARKQKEQPSLSSGSMTTTSLLPVLPFMLSAASSASISTGSGLGSLFFPVQETQQPYQQRDQQQQQEQQQQQRPGEQTPSRSNSLCSTVVLFEEFRETEV